METTYNEINPTATIKFVDALQNIHCELFIKYQYYKAA